MSNRVISVLVVCHPPRPPLVLVRLVLCSCVCAHPVPPAGYLMQLLYALTTAQWGEQLTHCDPHHPPPPLHSNPPCLFIGQHQYWWGGCLPRQTNAALRHGPHRWGAPRGRDQNERGPEPDAVLLKSTALSPAAVAAGGRTDGRMLAGPRATPGGPARARFDTVS